MKRKHPFVAAAAVAAVLLWSLLAAAAIAAAASLDSSFGDAGVASAPTSSALAVGDLASQGTDGSMLAAVSSWEEGADTFAVARFRGEGALDRGFGEAGLSEVPAGGRLGDELQAQGVAALPGGRSLVVGYRTRSSGRDLRTAPLLARFLPDGGLDRGFGDRGLVAPSLRSRDGEVVMGVEVEPSGRILAVGARNERVGGKPAGLVLAYRPDGSPDRSFGRGGRVLFPASRDFRYTGLSDIVRRPGGGLLVSGYRHGRLFVAALLRNGSLDRRFGGGDGKVSIGLGGTGGCLAGCGPRTALVLAKRGILVLGTQSRSQTVLGRLRFDGRLDRGFGRGGLAARGAGNRLSNPSALAVQGNGSIVVAGTDSRTTAAGRVYYVFAALRFMSAGELDRGFGASGLFSLPGSHNSAGFAALTQPSGKVVAAGGMGPDEGAPGDPALLLTRFRP